MPRVAINKNKYMMSDFQQWILIRMKMLRMSQKELGELLDLSQQAFSYRLKNDLFTYSEIIVILKNLQATDSEIIKLMKL